MPTLNLCVLLLLVNQYVYTFHALLWYMLARLLFIYLSTYFTSYFRKPTIS